MQAPNAPAPLKAPMHSLSNSKPNLPPSSQETDWLGSACRALFWPALAVILFLFTVPVYLLLKVSISPPSEVLTQHPSFWIHHPTFEHWAAVLQGGELWGPLTKSLLVATFTTILAVAIAAPASYVIARFPRKIRYATILSLLFTRMFPDILIALPVAIIFIKWGLLDTVPGLVLAHLIGNLPFLAWILVGTFETIPATLEEAANVDGCSRLGALVRVIFPAAAPGIMVGALFVWLNSWNEFTYAMYLSTANKTLPLQTYFYQIKGSWFDSAAYATVLTIPVVLITFALQRYLVSGSLSGAVKG
jgi:trehalose transport system permease protein